MKIYEITIKPLTAFGTPLKGDTIFGHICWQAAYDEKLFGMPLKDLIADYQSNPFAVFSSAFPTFYIGTECYYVLRTPALPVDEIFDLPAEKSEIIEKRKEYKAKRWMILKKKKRFESFKTLEFLDDSELFEKMKGDLSLETRRQLRREGTRRYISSFLQYHNTINRLTGTTGEDPFAPFSVEQSVFCPETELTIFAGIDETRINIQQLRDGLERVGSFGFGRDASTGLGRFDLAEDGEIDLLTMGSTQPNACYTLSPCVPEDDTFEEVFFTPFTRYGRHGDVLAKSANPFKNPVIMADEGAIFKPKTETVFGKPYIGIAVTNLSKAEPNTVAQGYSLYIPVRVEV